MPVESECLNALAVLWPNVSCERQGEHNVDHQQTHDDVGCMETDERVEGGSEEIGADGQMIPYDELVPLARSAEEEDKTKKKGGAPPERKARRFSALDRTLREPDGEATGEQADCVEDRTFQNLPRRGTVLIPTHVEDVSDYKDGEDGGFGDDEACYADTAARRRVPDCLVLEVIERDGSGYS